MKKPTRKARTTSGARAKSSGAVPEAPSVSEPGGSAGLSSQALAEIRTLIELVAEKQITEFEYERGDFRLRIQRGGARPAAEAVVGGQPQLVMTPPPPPVYVPVPAAEAVRETPAAAPAENLHVITSPIVGTFYRAASPTAEPFAKPGDIIEKGRALCIIEAMKLMNEINAEVSGEIVRVLAENGQPVEYGQPLFEVRL
ncbi:MAG: acetyl-CoA carboxylase biotin carboxyl carrier protein [Blastocatellia bacterium]